MTRSALVLVFLAAALLSGACGSSSPSAPSAIGVPFSQTDVVVGTGAEATAGRTLSVNYTGWLYDTATADHKGRMFDTSVGRGAFSFRLGAGAVIRGWDQGLVGMRVGGRRVLVLPPDLAYGSSGSGSTIPPNATLIFDVELLAAQ